MTTRATSVSIAFGIASIALATSAHAQPGVLPSFRLSMGAASAESPTSRDPGFAGHMDLGLFVFNYTSATDAGPMLDTMGDIVAPIVGQTSTKAGFVGRIGLAYDRTGPGDRVARNFALTAQVGYGLSIVHVCLGTAFLTGRVDGGRARGARLNAVVSFVQGLAFLDVSSDFWRTGGARLRDVRVVAGIDVLVFGAQIARGYD